MLRQVRLNHRVFDANNPSVSFQRRVFAFGSHELAIATEIVPDVSTALALNNEIRLIVDELLVGNNLEEIKCRGVIDAGNDRFSRVPIGADPDDIAACSGPDDALAGTCSGPTSVCICNIPDEQGGCMRDSGSAVAFGQPVGVEDQNQDGATDDTQFIAGAVSIECGTFAVPLRLNGNDSMTPADSSYWNPSGDQNRPAMGGFDALGPAIVLKTDGPMPTNLPCKIVAAADVVDKEGIQLCAPPNGDINASCTPGDLSAFAFTTEPLQFAPASWSNNEMGVSRMDPAVFSSNTNVKAASVVASNIQVLEGDARTPLTPGTDFTVTFNPAMPTLFTLTYTTPLLANTVYRVVVTPGLVDTWDQPVPVAQEFTFTTGP